MMKIHMQSFLKKYYSKLPIIIKTKTPKIVRNAFLVDLSNLMNLKDTLKTYYDRSFLNAEIGESKRIVR